MSENNCSAWSRGELEGRPEDLEDIEIVSRVRVKRGRELEAGIEESSSEGRGAR